jgi:serine/threonine-protein kinase RsbW
MYRNKKAQYLAETTFMIFNLNNLHHDEDDRKNGIGIKLIDKIADELSYTRSADDRRNCLLMVKKFQPGFFKQAIATLNSLILAEQSLKKITLRVNTDIKAVAQVLLWVEQLGNLQIPEAVLHESKLLAIEGFTNAVQHAHKTLPSGTPIDLAISVFNERLEIEIWDWGEPFDLKAKLKEELQELDPFGLQELGFMLECKTL